MSNFKFELGIEAKDKVTGIKGIIIGRIEYVFGCNQYGIAPKAPKNGKRPDTEYFDEGRIVSLGRGINPRKLQTQKPGADFNRDQPR